MVNKISKGKLVEQPKGDDNDFDNTEWAEPVESDQANSQESNLEIQTSLDQNNINPNPDNTNQNSLSDKSNIELQTSLDQKNNIDPNLSNMNQNTLFNKSPIQNYKNIEASPNPTTSSLEETNKLIEKQNSLRLLYNDQSIKFNRERGRLDEAFRLIKDTILKIPINMTTIKILNVKNSSNIEELEDQAKKSYLNFNSQYEKILRRFEEVEGILKSGKIVLDETIDNKTIRLTEDSLRIAKKFVGSINEHTNSLLKDIQEEVKSLDIEIQNRQKPKQQSAQPIIEQNTKSSRLIVRFVNTLSKTNKKNKKDNQNVDALSEADIKNKPPL